MLTDPDASSEHLSKKLEAGLGTEKHIVVVRFGVDSEPTFVEVTLPAGQASGIRVTSSCRVYSSDVKEILRLYDEWLEQHAQLGSPNRASNDLKFDGVG